MSHISIQSLRSFTSSQNTLIANDTSSSLVTLKSEQTSTYNSDNGVYNARKPLTHSKSLKIPLSSQRDNKLKRYSEPTSSTKIKRWDDSQLEIELAEDDHLADHIKNKKTHQVLTRIRSLLPFMESSLKYRKA